MKKFLKIVGWLLVVLVVVALGAYAWAYTTAKRAYEQHWTAHAVSFPIPYPLSPDERRALEQERIAAGASSDNPLAGVDVEAVTLTKAIARGKHLVESRTGCDGCHGKDFGGDVLVDSAFVGYYAAPNLTSGEGGITKGFTSREWDLAVRHGIRHDMQTSAMPSQEFLTLSDHELSDIASYIQSVPPVNKTMKPVKLGPVFAFMLALDTKGSLIAYGIDHNKPHAAEPPVAVVSVELGQHIAQTCTGCHNPQFSGGKVAGDPNMPIVGNLTPHETGLKGWTEADFMRALRTGVRPDGTAIKEQMPWKTYGQMSDTELKAVFAFLQTLPPLEKGKH